MTIFVHLEFVSVFIVFRHPTKFIQPHVHWKFRGAFQDIRPYDITEEYWEDFAEMTGIEYVKINKETKTYEFKQQLQNNEMYYMLNKALK